MNKNEPSHGILLRKSNMGLARKPSNKLKKYWSMPCNKWIMSIRGKKEVNLSLTNSVFKDLATRDFPQLFYHNNPYSQLCIPNGNSKSY